MGNTRSNPFDELQAVLAASPLPYESYDLNDRLALADKLTPLIKSCVSRILCKHIELSTIRIEARESMMLCLTISIYDNCYGYLLKLIDFCTKYKLRTYIVVWVWLPHGYGDKTLSMFCQSISTSVKELYAKTVCCSTSLLSIAHSIVTGTDITEYNLDFQSILLGMRIAQYRVSTREKIKMISERGLFDLQKQVVEDLVALCTYPPIGEANRYRLEYQWYVVHLLLRIQHRGLILPICKKIACYVIGPI